MPAWRDGKDNRSQRTIVLSLSHFDLTIQELYHRGMLKHDSNNSSLSLSDQALDTPSQTLGRSTSMFFLVVFTLAALAGNGIICYLVHTKYHLRTIPNRLVLNLSWCGALTALFNGPLMLITTAKQDWILGKCCTICCGKETWAEAMERASEFPWATHAIFRFHDALDFGQTLLFGVCENRH